MIIFLLVSPVDDTVLPVGNGLVKGVTTFFLSIVLVLMSLVTLKFSGLSVLVVSIGGILFWLAYCLLNKRIDRRLLLAKSKKLPAFSDRWLEIDEIQGEIALLKADSWFTSNLDFLHETYHDTKSVEQLYVIVDEGRAETLSEALNCLKADRHREKMENYQLSILDETQRLRMVAAASSYYAATANCYQHSKFYHT